MIAGDLPEEKSLDLMPQDLPQVINIIDYYGNRTKFLQIIERFDYVFIKIPEKQMIQDGPIFISSQKVVGNKIRDQLFEDLMERSIDGNLKYIFY